MHAVYLFILNSVPHRMLLCRAMIVQQLVLDIMASDPAYWNPHTSALRRKRRGNKKGRAPKLKGSNVPVDSTNQPPATFGDLLAASNAVGRSLGGMIPLTAIAYAARRGIIPLAEARVRFFVVLVGSH